LSGPTPETPFSQTTIENKAQLVSYLENGCKPETEWRIGTEHEKFPFLKSGNAPVPYAGAQSIKALLEGLRDQYGWNGVTENGNIIALTAKEGYANISLEPGGQFELSGAAFQSLHETSHELDTHLAQSKSVAKKLDIGFLGLGASPIWTRSETPVMPKGRYGIMAPYMDKVGTMGRDMMFRTCTVQVNLDFGSEADMVKKLRVSLALQPVATALFANSPFLEGKPNGFKSFRSHVWTDTDNARAGMLPFMFEDGAGFERYVDYALNVPMYFTMRNGSFVNTAGGSFRKFLDGRLPQLPGEKPTMRDWADHLTTLFPEVRLKKYLEMRGADAGMAPMLKALPAFWTGLLYDKASLDAAWQLVKSWPESARQKLRNDVPRLALQASIGGRSVHEIARDVLNIARKGLQARGQDEAIYLDPLDAIVATGKTSADILLDKYHDAWSGDVAPVFIDNEY
jgi:glutamate--cysteine ligase